LKYIEDININDYFKGRFIFYYSKYEEWYKLGTGQSFKFASMGGGEYSINFNMEEKSLKTWSDFNLLDNDIFTMCEADKSDKSAPVYISGTPAANTMCYTMGLNELPKRDYRFVKIYAKDKQIIKNVFYANNVGNLRSGAPITKKRRGTQLELIPHEMVFETWNYELKILN